VSWQSCCGSHDANTRGEFAPQELERRRSQDIAKELATLFEKMPATRQEEAWTCPWCQFRGTGAHCQCGGPMERLVRHMDAMDGVSRQVENAWIAHESSPCDETQEELRFAMELWIAMRNARK
jgi:hypothetical protein